MMKSREMLDPHMDLPAGYKGLHSEDYEVTDRDLELGFCSYGMIELDDMFGAFTQRQMGVVGGDKTVDDYSPEGVDWHVGDVGVGGAHGNLSRGSGRVEGRRSSVPEYMVDSEKEAMKVGKFDEDQGGRSSHDRDSDEDEDDYRAPGRGKRYP